MIRTLGLAAICPEFQKRNERATLISKVEMAIHASQTEEQPPGNADSIREMAAGLFAELFYKQWFAEREMKRHRGCDEAFDSQSGIDVV